MQLPTSKRPDPDAAKFEALARAVEAVKAETTRRGLGRGHGGHGRMPCPATDCRGLLTFIVYTTNGHVMASCSQRGCINIVE